MSAHDVKRGTVDVNGAELYHEVRGDGPPLLFVSGATGDAGHWAKVVDAFADDHTVVTYDRRGNSRSPVPPGWTSTSMSEQADDAAALLEALALRPATLAGSSGGALIVLELLERAPQAVRAAVVHEPVLLELASDEELPELLDVRKQGPGEGEARAAMVEFLRVFFGESVVDALEPELRERMLGNAEVTLGTEPDAFLRFALDTDRLRRCGVPLTVARGRETQDDPALRFLHQAAAELAERAGAPLRETTGKHVPYLSHPEAFAMELRSILAELRG